MTLAHRFAFVLLSLALAAPASAQDMVTALPNNFTLSDILNRQRVEAAISLTTGAIPFVGSSARREGPVQSTAYHPSRQVSSRVRQQFDEWMASLAGVNGGRRIAAAMDERDPVRSWAKIVADDGLKPGDLADAVTSYWVLNWVIANGADSTRDQTQAVRRQVRRIIASSPGYERLSEAERQEMSEVLMLNFLIQHAAYTDALSRGDRATTGRLGEAAVARFQGELGINLRQLMLTDAGFVRS